MTRPGPALTMEQQLREMNEALLLSSVKQHELTEKAEKAEAVSARLAAIVDCSDDAIYSKDLSGIITTWNKGAQRLYGYAAEEVIGQPLTLLIPPDNFDEEAQILERVRKGELVDHYETVRRHKDGTLLDISLTVSPLRDSKGSIFGASKIARDVTEHKRAESLIRCQKQSLEMLVNGEPLEPVLDFLARSMESQSQGKFLVAIHLMEADGHHFGYVAAPSLPARYAQATRGMDARLELGCCSSAVMSHTPTIVRDFADPLPQTRWPAFSAAAVSLGLRGCFTTPILSSDRSVLGTFAIYYREPRDPSPNDRQLVEIVTHTVAIAIERKQAEQALREAEERFRHLADNIPQLAWIADAGTDGQVHWFNQNWYEYTGTTLEQMNGQGWHTVHHPDHAERVIEKFAHHVHEGLDWEDTFPLRGKDGQYRWFLSRMKVIRDATGAVSRIFGTNTDVTEQRRMADALRQNAADMSEADRRKDEFLAMLSHELRSPLAPISNAVQLLGLQEGSENLIQQQARTVIERQLKQLQRLVDDLLEVSRITTGRVQLLRERVVVSDIVERVVETVHPLIEQRQHELMVSLPPEPIWLNADVTRLEQVIANLLTNAAKYTSEGGQIWLTVEEVASGECRVSSDGRKSGEWRVASGEKEESEPAASTSASPLTTHHSPVITPPATPHVVIRVRDTGIGIPQELLPHIFDLFTQAERSLDRSQGGLGIGLALVRRLTELHGGTVEAVSELGQGSEFVVRLPLLSDEGRGARGEQDEDKHATSPSPLTTHHSPLVTPLRVLVVDDNVDAAMSFSMLLRTLGHDVRTAHDGLTAVPAAIDYQPDAVLLDIGLPGLNGYEIAKRIRREPTLQNVLLVALTGYGQESDRQTALQAGFNHHLVKPARLEQLQKILATVSVQVT